MENINNIISTLINEKALKATQYISPKKIIRAVRTRSGNKLMAGNIQITLTIGEPNYLEREFIKACKKSNEPFPIKKIQLKFLPKIKKAK